MANVLTGHSFLLFKILVKVVITLAFYMSISCLFLAFCDLTIIYFMTSNLCGFKAIDVFKNLSIILIISFVVFFLFFFYSLPSTIYAPLTPILMIFTTFGLVKIQKVNLLFNEKFFIWLHYYILANALLIPITIITDMPFFPFPFYLLRYFIYGLGVILIIYLCQKLDLNKLLIFVLRRTSLKITFFIVASFFIFFSFTSTHLKRILGHHFLLLMLSIPILIGAFYAIKHIHQSTTLMPEAYHDVKKSMMLLHLRAEKITHLSELTALIDESIQLKDLKLPTPTTSLFLPKSEQERFEKLIKETIELAKIDRQTGVAIVSTVHFTSHHSEINDIKLAYMLSLLLEYFLDSLTQKPIYININSSQDQLIIGLSSEYKFEKSRKNLELFLGEDHYSPPKTSNQFNLLRLKSLIIDHNGKTTITVKKHSQERTDYLFVDLDFKKRSDLDVK